MIFNRDGLDEGKKRYGSKTLKNQKRSCPKCGKALEQDAGTSGPWGAMWKCPDHGLISSIDIVYNSDEKIRYVKAPVPKHGERSDYDPMTQHKCIGCGKVGSGPTYGPSICKECIDDGVRLQNDGDIKCPWCDKSYPSKDRLYDHTSYEHEKDIPSTQKGMRDARENASGCAACGHSFYSHSQDYSSKWHCQPGCKCDGYYINNAGPIRCSCGGTVEQVPGQDDLFECDECGQTYEKDDWGRGRLKAIQNMACPICDKEEGDALTQHLQKDHDMDAQDAAVVSKDMETRRNAAGKLIVAGGDSDEVAFVHCRSCDEGISESKIQEHVNDGHTVEKVMKVENAAGDIPASSMGYQTTTTSTTCQRCGHTIGQVFADGECDCDCHREKRENSVDWKNVDCPACGKAGSYLQLQNHLRDFHDMDNVELENALGAAIKLNDLENAAEKCSRCGASVPEGSGAHRDYDVYCDECCAEKGYETDKELGK